jgi:hypothetical protein
MTRRSADDRTLDLFVVPEADSAPAGMDYRSQVSGLVGRVLKAACGDRHEVAARASGLTGTSVTKCMLDAYASEARETFNLPFYLVPAIESACESLELSNWLAATRGGRLLVGRDALAGELAKLERQRAQASRRISRLRKVMEVTK